MARPDDEDRVLTRHPAGKNGVRILRARYDDLRRALLAVVPADEQGVPFADLEGLVAPLLDPDRWRDARLVWFVVAVKQDLEARGELEVVPRSRPQRVRRP